jgi:hypothetical protein
VKELVHGDGEEELTIVTSEDHAVQSASVGQARLAVPFPASKPLWRTAFDIRLAMSPELPGTSRTTSPNLRPTARAPFSVRAVFWTVRAFVQTMPCSIFPTSGRH